MSVGGGSAARFSAGRHRPTPNASRRHPLRFARPRARGRVLVDEPDLLFLLSPKPLKDLLPRVLSVDRFLGKYEHTLAIALAFPQCPNGALLGGVAAVGDVCALVFHHQQPFVFQHRHEVGEKPAGRRR